MPKIDIALASYNGEKYISAQLNSILSNQIQTPGFSLGSIVVSDNMSSDRTTDIVTECVQQYPNIKLMQNTQRGVKNNFQHAMMHTNADYVMLSDQDDVWFNNKIERSIQKLLELENQAGKSCPILVFSDLCVSDCELNTIDSSFFKFQHIQPDDYQFPAHIFLSNIAPGCTMIFNRRLLELALPFPDDAVIHDWWLMLVASSFGKVSYINDATMQYRQHNNNQIGAPDSRFRKMLFSPLFAIRLAKTRLQAASRQAQIFRNKFPHAPVNAQITIDFLADFEHASKIARLSGLIDKKIRYRNTIKTTVLYLLALMLPRKK